jgi:hypothetical protein
MLKWVRRIAIATVATGLIAITLGPWLVYWLALSKIDGRPSRAPQGEYNAEDVAALLRKLREPQPLKVEPMSPHSFLVRLYASAHLSADTFPPGSRLATMIAREHNARHLADHGWWHPSGAALTIWLTRNWTPDELIAKGIELSRTRKPRVAH